MTGNNAIVTKAAVGAILPEDVLSTFARSFVSLLEKRTIIGQLGLLDIPMFFTVPGVDADPEPFWVAEAVWFRRACPRAI